MHFIHYSQIASIINKKKNKNEQMQNRNQTEILWIRSYKISTQTDLVCSQG